MAECVYALTALGMLVFWGAGGQLIVFLGSSDVIDFTGFPLLLLSFDLVIKLVVDVFLLLLLVVVPALTKLLQVELQVEFVRLEGFDTDRRLNLWMFKI